MVNCMFPKVSICIPTYNEPKYLKKLLESVFVQNYLDYEVVITDDTQDDRINNVINQYGDSKLRYFKNEKRLGSPENWNEAVRHAKGEYIKIMHHDTWFLDENSLREYINMLENNPNCDFAFSGTLCEFSSTNETKVHAADEIQRSLLSENPDILFAGNFIGSPSATIYRSTVKEQFDINLRWVVDIDFYIRVLRINKEYGFTPKPTLVETDSNRNRITNECINSKKIELYEYIYLYNKLYRKGNKKAVYGSVIKQKFMKYGIKSIRELKDLEITVSKQAYYIKWLVLISSLCTLKVTVTRNLKRAYLSIFGR